MNAAALSQPSRADLAARRALILIFFVSGFSGLIYESLWSHYLKLFLGHAAYAQSLTLTIFMGGMAIGAALTGRFSHRIKNLLFAYALAEIGVGSLALGFHPIFAEIVDKPFVAPLSGAPAPVVSEAYKWGVAAALLLPPAALLGATFPLMSGAVLRRYPGQDGRHLAILYFSNSVGAAVGVLTASFLLIERFGLPGTMNLAAGINIAIGAGAAYLSRKPETIPRAQTPETAATYPNLRAAFLAAAFVTGAASFVYEIVWIRMLSLVLGSSFHAFELMLGAFITGLALGSLAIGRYIERIGDPLKFAAFVQLGMGALAVGTLPLYVQSFEWMGALVNGLAKDDTGYVRFLLASHGIAFAIMLPATFLAGMTLPLFTHILIKRGYGEKSVGSIYAFNTLGAIVGVTLAVHILMPNIGLKLSLAGGALMDMALGLLLLRATGSSDAGRLAALASLAVPLLVVRYVALDAALLGGGVYRTGSPRLENAATLFYRDGKTASINVSQVGSIRIVLTNGKPDAAIQMNPAAQPTPDEITMVMLGAIPQAVRPDAKKIANIGFGSGLTTHTLLLDPSLEELATVEIEPAVVEGARAFLPNVRRAYDDPRSHIYIEDAKTWFAQRNETFDIIISEPSNPWVSGVASLFSSEFYRRIRSYLNERGVLVQWLHLYEFDARLAASVIGALHEHFSDYAVYLTSDSDFMIVAAKTGKLPPLSPHLFDSKELSQSLSRIGIDGMDDIALRRLGTAATMTPMLEALGAPKNSDYYPYLELHAPKARFLHSKALEFPTMGLYPLPLIQMLDTQDTAWAPERLTPTKSMRYERIKQAQTVMAALLDRPYEDRAAGEKALALRQRLERCAQEDTDGAIQALHELALVTLAHLDPKNLAALWSEPKWMKCQAPELAARMALYGAIARRDAPAMLAAAESALEERDDNPDRRRYALEAALLAARALADDAAVHRLWTRYGPTLYADGLFSPALALLLNYKTESK